MYPLIDICPHAACRQPYALTFIQCFIDVAILVSYRNSDRTRSQSNANPAAFSPFIIETPQIFFFVKRCPKLISENAHSRHQPQKAKGGFSFCGKIHFALPQLPPPASTSLLPPSTLLPIQFLSYLPNFSLHLLSHQIQIRGNMLQLHTRTTLQVS